MRPVSSSYRRSTGSPVPLNGAVAPQQLSISGVFCRSVPEVSARRIRGILPGEVLIRTRYSPAKQSWTAVTQESGITRAGWGTESLPGLRGNAVTSEPRRPWSPGSPGPGSSPRITGPGTSEGKATA